MHKALLFALAGALAAMTATGQTPQYGNTAGNRNAARASLQGPISDRDYAANMLQSNSLIYLEDEYPFMVGYGYEFNEQSGEWELRQPVFYSTLDSNYDLQSLEVEFGRYLNSTKQTSTSQQNFDIAGGIGLVKFAASVNNNQHASASFLSSSISLQAKKIYLPKLVNLTVPQSYTLLPAAQALVSNTAGLSEQARSDIWKATFGTHIAIGFGLKNRLGVKVSLSDQESFAARSTLVSLEGAYSGVSAAASIGQFATDAQRTAGLALSLDWTAATSPGGALAIPDFTGLTGNALISAQTAFSNALLTAIDNAVPSKVGVFLLPVQAFPSAPTLVGQASWDSFYVGLAGASAYEAQALLLDSARWNSPASLRDFLSNRLVPNSNVSYQADLDAKRVALLVALDDLWTKLKVYLQDAGTPTEAFSIAQLNAAVAEVSAKELAMQSIATELGLLSGSLAPVTVTAVRSAPSPAFVNCNGGTYTYDVTVNNFAFFPRSLFNRRQNLVDYLSECGQLPGIANRSHFEFVINQSCPNGGSVQFVNYGTTAASSSSNPVCGDMMSILDPVLLPNNGTGLYNFTLRFSFRAHPDASKFEFHMVDFFNRLGKSTLFQPY
jgi:hypothetical protein